MATAIITGASRGVGRGIAVALAKSGYDICVTGRSKADLDRLKQEIEISGRSCHVYVCDHLNFEESNQTFATISQKHEISLIVNNAWGGYETMVLNGNYTWEDKFWDQTASRWSSMIDVGVRTAFFCSKYCVRGMLAKKSGAIINISFWAAQNYMQNVIYGVSKAAIDKMTKDMAHELQEYGIPVISLYPGLVRTEKVLENAQFFDMSNSESPEFAGLVINGFMRDPARAQKTGGVFTTAGLAADYGILDIDGKQIKP